MKNLRSLVIVALFIFAFFAISSAKAQTTFCFSAILFTATGLVGCSVITRKAKKLQPVPIRVK